MSGPAATLRAAPWSDLVHDPLFAMGYGEIWRDEAMALSRDWDGGECHAYGRGRSFGAFVRDYEGARVPLLRAGTVHPRCLVLLVLAERCGVLP